MVLDGIRVFLAATLVWVPLIINETVINENVILKYLLIILIFIRLG